MPFFTTADLSLAEASDGRRYTHEKLTLVIKPRTVIVNRVQELSS